MDVVFILTLTLMQALHLVLTPLKKLYSVVANLARLVMAWIWWFVVCILVLLIYSKLLLSFNVWNTTFVYFLPCSCTLSMLIYYCVRFGCHCKLCLQQQPRSQIQVCLIVFPLKFSTLWFVNAVQSRYIASPLIGQIEFNLQTST